MSKNEKTSLVPKFRFPEFKNTAEWDESAIGEVFNNRQESGFLSLSLMSLTDEFGIIPQADSSKKDTSNSDKSKYLRICIGDIVYNTMRMWQGRCAYSAVEGIVSPAYTVCTPKSGNNGLFFYFYFKTFNMIKKFHANSQGLVNDTLSLKYDAFSQISIAYPLGQEQQKIADCLSSLDDLIAAEVKKLEALKAHKKGLMRKLFPAEGETVPQVRFEGYTGEWEQRKYSDLINLLSGQDFEPSDYNELGIGTPYMTGASCIIEGETIVNRWTEKLRCVAYKGDVLLVCKGSGYGAIARLVQEKAHIARQFMALQTLPNLDKTFNYYLAASVVDNIKKDARGLIVGIAREAVLQQDVMVPSLAEQATIGTFLRNLDEIIITQKEKIGTLKLHKKGLMQGLFPSIEEVGE